MEENNNIHEFFAGIFTVIFMSIAIYPLTFLILAFAINHIFLIYNIIMPYNICFIISALYCLFIIKDAGTAASNQIRLEKYLNLAGIPLVTSSGLQYFLKYFATISVLFASMLISNFMEFKHAPLDVGKLIEKIVVEQSKIE
jgi:hypothetical protein